MALLAGARRPVARGWAVSVSRCNCKGLYMTSRVVTAVYRTLSTTVLLYYLMKRMKEQRLPRHHHHGRFGPN